MRHSDRTRVAGDNPADISKAGLEHLKQFEGWRDHVYNDVAGYPTIGYGHLIKDGEEFPDRITIEQGEALLRQDADIAIRAVAYNVKVPITQGMFDALVSFTYNVGTGALRKSTLLRLLNDGEYIDAARQFPRWNKAGGKVVAGLTKRRNSETWLFWS